MVYPNSDKITYKYDLRRLVESVTDERGKVTSYEFDSAYRLRKITDPLLHTREFDYDLMSNMVWQKDGLGHQTDYKYDDFDRLKEIEYPAAETALTRLKEQFEYDKLGRLKKITDTASRVTNYNYDDANRTKTVTNAELETTTTKYNARGYLIEVKDAKNQVYSFVPDALGRVLSQTRAGGTMSFEYDENGNRKKRTDYLGRVTRYTFDKLDRLEKIEYGLTDVLQPTVTYSYDDISRLVSATNENGTVGFGYDNRNRVTSTTDVFGHTINYDYLYDNATLNRLQLKFDGANYAQYNYDDAGRLANIVNSSDSSTITFGYDNADRLTSRILPNGITTTYGYDNMSRLKQLKDQSPTATLFDRQYGYNNASQINQIAEPSQVRNFGYDNVDRLTSMTSPTVPNENYTFDDVGNRLTSHRSANYGYEPNQFNRIASTETANYVYDANGNIRQKAEGKELWRYGWDFENRMTSASTRKQTVRYKYDALGRRIQRYKVGGEENTKFIYDGNDVLVDDNKGTLTKYLNGQGIDDKLRVQTGNDVKYFISDHLGSTNALTDTSGNVTSSASYDSFGNATGNLTTRYQFTGREFDSFTGLHFYRARWYDGNLGRFISEDPIGFAGGDVNLYGYVWNNSLAFRDPSGKIVPFIIGAVVVGGLILSSPEYVNAPGPGDPVYRPENTLILNAAGGAGCGYLLKRFGGPLVNRILFGEGDELIELGISQGPIKPAPSNLPKNTFPDNPDDLLPDLPRDPKGRIYPSDKIRIRPEQHPLEPGEIFSPRHHGQHYHVETRIDPTKSWNNKNNVIKILPKGYKLGDGTGFIPGEVFPNSP